MADQLQIMSGLKRPQLLIRAARAGLADYNRGRDLRRLMHVNSPPPPDRALPALLAEEGRLEEFRRRGDGSYSFARHIDLLIAMMAEARLIPGHDSAVRP